MRSRLNVVLAERRVTKAQVQQDLRLSKGTVWRWSTDEGIEGVTLGKLAALARYLGCRISDLYEE